MFQNVYVFKGQIAGFHEETTHKNEVRWMKINQERNSVMGSGSHSLHDWNLDHSFLLLFIEAFYLQKAEVGNWRGTVQISENLMFQLAQVSSSAMSSLYVYCSFGHMLAKHLVLSWKHSTGTMVLLSFPFTLCFSTTSCRTNNHVV